MNFTQTADSWVPPYHLLNGLFHDYVTTSHSDNFFHRMLFYADSVQTVPYLKHGKFRRLLRLTQLQAVSHMISVELLHDGSLISFLQQCNSVDLETYLSYWSLGFCTLPSICIAMTVSTHWRNVCWINSERESFTGWFHENHDSLQFCSIRLPLHWAYRAYLFCICNLITGKPGLYCLINSALLWQSPHMLLFCR